MNPALRLRPGLPRSPRVLWQLLRSPGRLLRPSAAVPSAGGTHTQAATAGGARTLGGFPAPVRGLRALAERCGDVGAIERAQALWGGR